MNNKSKAKKRSPHRWTDTEREFVRENFMDMTDRELAEHIDRTEAAINSYRQKHGIVNRSRYWDEQEIRVLKEHYTDTPTKELAGMLPGRSVRNIYAKAHSMGITKDESFLNDMNKKIGKKLAQNEASKAARFSKGHTPMNKGMSQEEYMSDEAIERTKATRFKPGNKPANTKYDGAITIRRDHPDRGGPAYMYIRLAEGNWEKYQRYLWEQKNGPIPDDKILVCKDGNTLNPKPANWELITRAENARRNRDWRKAMKTMERRRNHPSKHLTDNYVAALLAGGDNELKEYILDERPDMIKVARANYKLARKIREGEDE